MTINEFNQKYLETKHADRIPQLEVDEYIRNLADAGKLPKHHPEKLSSFPLALRRKRS